MRVVMRRDLYFGTRITSSCSIDYAFLQLCSVVQLLQTFDAQLFDLEDRETMLALHGLEVPLSPLFLLLCPHRLAFGTHNHGSTLEQAIIDVCMLALGDMWNEVRCL